MTTPPEPHRDQPYIARRYEPQAAIDVLVNNADEYIEVQAVCPGCGGETTRRYDWDRPNIYKGGIFRRPVEAAPATATMTCECGFAHENRPDTVSFRGCGGTWVVSLGTSR